MLNKVHAGTTTRYGTTAAATAATTTTKNTAVALDPAHVTIKIVDAEPEAERYAEAAVDELELKPLLPPTRQSQPPSPPVHHSEQPTAVLRLIVALLPNAIFACVSGALGVVGAAVVATAALSVFVAARVAQIFEGLALMLLTTDQALVQFSTGDTSTVVPIVVDATKSTRPAVGELLSSVGRSLLILSSDLLAIGFFKGTLGISYCSSLYIAATVPAMLWAAAADQDTTTASAFFDRQLFGDSAMAFTALHSVLWLLALGWLVVTASMSRICSHNLRRVCE